ncbi:type VI secretion system Vgr family protein [Pseudoduganella namucuonensis]|uniref:Type VI secretion system secreted protein VgrG n=1 Tax=Pseudoduganella namucuonensis TaxID=1035707 RepID=A0A1I7KPS1_9BURK|nr:type VI secretion system tip protein VgrG [Pseudoduganella namucuonensis]SFU99411.1 type VI secretion system secreted protein VgrG [Pseudoduganella namucuonensis]
MRRMIEITTPLGDEALLFHRMRAREELGRLSEFEIDLLSERGDIAPTAILGANVTVKLELAERRVRHFNGYVTAFRQAGTHGRYQAYQATVRPWLWFLTRTADCRIFQDLSAPDIVKRVCGEHSVADIKDELSGRYRRRGYCVQYRETDFDFVSRLMEQEGMYYYFTHADGRHTMVLADGAGAHRGAPGYESLPFIDVARAARPGQEYINRWLRACEIQPGRYATTAYDFERPGASLAARAAQARGHALDDYEVYDYPGPHLDSADGEQYADTRLDEMQAGFDTAQGASNARGLAAGALFRLTGQPRGDQNREYLLTAVDYRLVQNGYESGQEGGDGDEPPGTDCACEFTALGAGQQFRPPRLTPAPLVRGPQTAVVVGPAGDEIHTDRYGRVKVQFHWDRYGQKNENSSCWIRVSHPWAGKNWGMIATPRIGQEVIVDFIEGDPDQPIVTGRVYNADQMPPWTLPANMTRTGMLSRSSKGGGGANANELRFEDKTGAEQVYLHAERNQDISVEQDEAHAVGRDRGKTIGRDEATGVGRDRSETVGNNETITIAAHRSERVGANETIAIGANRSETVGANETIAIGGNRGVTVGASETATVALQRTHSVGVNETITVGAAQEVTIGALQLVTVGASQTVNVGDAQSVSVGADMSEDIGGAQSSSVAKGRSASVGEDDALRVGKKLVIDAGDSVTITTGAASITMKKDGTIQIKGKDISINGSGGVSVKAGGDVVVKGSKVGIN